MPLMLEDISLVTEEMLVKIKESATYTMENWSAVTEIPPAALKKVQVKRNATAYAKPQTCEEHMKNLIGIQKCLVTSTKSHNNPTFHVVNRDSI